MHEDLARALGWDEEIGRLEKLVAERFGDWAVAEAHQRSLQAVPLEPLTDPEGMVVGEYRKGLPAAIKAELRRLLTEN